MENRLKIVEETKNYWRVIIDNPPINNFDPYMFAELNVLMNKMEKNSDLRVVVFESANEDFFMNHHDVEHRQIIPEMEGAAPFFYEWANWVERLVNLHVLSIAKVRGRARAQGFEFALACDIIFASKETAKFALIEVGGGSIPGGGGIEWLCNLCGRSRALEIVLSADDYDADTGELYGFVNRSIPDEKLDEFVDKFARRLGKFPKKVFDLGKEMVNARSKIPSKGDFYMSNFILNSVDSANDDIESYKMMKEKGMGSHSDFELNLAERIAELNG